MSHYLISTAHLFYSCICLYICIIGKDVTYEIQKDPGVTGNFEVTLVETGELIHSKKAGKGKCESNAERAAVVEKIQAYLDEKN